MTQPIFLYYFGSPNSRKVTIMLEELGVPYEIVPIKMSRGDPKRDDYKVLAPSQKMPVIVDPELTVSVPPRITAATGMDAITQLIESYISLRAAPIPQALAIHGLALAAGAITRAVEDGKDRDARERMAHAARRISVEQYEAARVVPMYEQFYARVTGQMVPAKGYLAPPEGLA